jgi:hypothetical protein
VSQGRKGHIGVGKETTFGTPVAAARYHRFRSEGIVTAIEEVTPPNILGVFDEGPTYQGLRTHSGPIEFDAHPVILGDYLLSGAGPVTTTNLEVGVRWQHDFAPRQTEFSADCIPQPLTLEVHRDLPGSNAFRFAGVGVNSMQFQFGVGNKILGASVGAIARSVAMIAPTTPVYEATRAFQWREAVITLPDPTVESDIQDLTINIENGYEGKAYIDGTQDIRRIRSAGSRVVTCSGVALVKTAENTAFIGGSERYLKIVFTGAALGAGNFRLEFWFPRFRYTAYPIGIGGPDEVMVSFAGKAKYDPAVADTPFKIRLVNGLSAY